MLKFSIIWLQNNIWLEYKTDSWRWWFSFSFFCSFSSAAISGDFLWNKTFFKVCWWLKCQLLVNVLRVYQNHKLFCRFSFLFLFLIILPYGILDSCEPFSIEIKQPLQETKMLLFEYTLNICFGYIEIIEFLWKPLREKSLKIALKVIPLNYIPF